MHDTAATDVNWVKVVASADLEACYGRLRDGIAKDTELRNKLPDIDEGSRFKFSFDRSGPICGVERNNWPIRSDRRWAIGMRLMLIGEELTFAQQETSGGPAQEHRLTVAIDNQGQIRYRVNGRKPWLLEWQVRQLMLQRVFFGLEVPFVTVDENI